MQGLVNRSIQNFLSDTFGEEVWRDIAQRSSIPEEGFEAMLGYDEAVTDTLIEAACTRLNRGRLDLLEDLGAYLTTREAVRRLLRYGGRDFVDFLRSLNELQGRTQMALDYLHLPELFLLEGEKDHFALEVRAAQPGWGAVLAGLVRAMADDYGALALIELIDPAPDGTERLSLRLLDHSHSRGRAFELSHAVGGAG
ncbi:heme NO-binding protein [Thioclava dalianensis]|uniref:Heme NO-binding protein n=1 Tax=Thioclava dalianensis TaxID=1185766 RepID=A0A074U5A7_9RHOB|nr:heme NO-binding domain-containing protein [Thioclava dalianensis]KEP69797.1 heme NO-binding protein [Thioclava dalianensis]SFM85997.1 Haem-NO-binding [Thioclava dalianensis]